jgi:hypothetical protein
MLIGLRVELDLGNDQSADDRRPGTKVPLKHLK